MCDLFLFLSKRLSKATRLKGTKTNQQGPPNLYIWPQSAFASALASTS